MVKCVAVFIVVEEFGSDRVCEIGSELVGDEGWRCRHELPRITMNIPFARIAFRDTAQVDQMAQDQLGVEGSERLTSVESNRMGPFAVQNDFNSVLVALNIAQEASVVNGLEVCCATLVLG